MSIEFKVDIEVYDTEETTWAQAKYLAHSYDDVLWTDDINQAIMFILESLKENS